MPDVKSTREAQFKAFVHLLQQSQLVIKTTDGIKVKDKDKFDQLGFVIYVCYLVSAYRKQNNAFCFIKINNHNTLLLTEFMDSPSIFILNRSITPGLFIEDVQSILESKDCVTEKAICRVEPFLRYNASNNILGKGFALKKFKDESRSKHSCNKGTNAWLNHVVKTDIDKAKSLGGFPYVINITPELFKVIFNVFDEGEMFTLIESLLNMYLATRIGAETSSEVCWPEAVLDNGKVVTFPADAIILNKSKNGLFVIETTTGSRYDSHSYFEKDIKGLDENTKALLRRHFKELTIDSHFKQKYINHKMFSLNEASKYKYVYIHFGKELFENSFHKDSLLSLANSEKNFEIMSLGKYKSVVTKINQNWWDLEYLEKSYNHLMSRLLTASNKILS